MIVKSYTAATVAAALKEIREELGGEAIVLRTRVAPHKEAGLSGRKYEVTACVDELLARAFRKKEGNSPAGRTKSPEEISEPEGHDQPPTTGKIEIARTESDVPKLNLDAVKQSDRLIGNGLPVLTPGSIEERLKPIYMNLINSDVPADIVNRLMTAIGEESGDADNIENVAHRIISEHLAASVTNDIRIENGTKIAFIGPSGAGKTSVLGKVAALLCTQYRQKIKLVSIKNEELPAPDEIGVYGAHLNIPVETPENVLKMKKDDSIVLIDTPPIGRDSHKSSELLDKIKGVNPDIKFFIFSACMRTHDLVDAVTAYKSISPDYLIATHLDETGRWGNIPAMLEYMNIPLAFITDTRGGTGQLLAPDPAVLAHQLLKREGNTDD